MSSSVDNPSRNTAPAAMDEVPERALAPSPTRANSKIFQRRLKEKISESRALELLDRKIKSESPASPAQESLTGVGSNQNQEDELVCDSTMVRFEASTPGPEECETRASSVLKTVRGIHRLRARDQQGPTRDNENQSSWT